MFEHAFYTGPNSIKVISKHSRVDYSLVRFSIPKGFHGFPSIGSGHLIVSTIYSGQLIARKLITNDFFVA